MLNSFKENFNQARDFNKYLKLRDESKLVMAPIIVEKAVEEKKEEPAKEAEKKPEAAASDKPKVDEAKK